MTTAPKPFGAAGKETEPMKATGVLVAQHRAIAGLFDEIDHEIRRQARARAVSRVAEELIAHMAGEEAVFYPALLRIVRLDPAAVERSRGEHLALRVEIRRVLSTRIGDPAFADRLSALRVLFHRHVFEEESRVFPRVERALSELDHQALGEEILASRPPIWMVTTEDRPFAHADDPILRGGVSLAIPPASE
jgi:hemerythrin superfamily protein